MIGSCKKLLIPIVILAIPVTAALFFLDDLRDWTLWLLAWFEGLGRWAAPLYVALYVVVILALVPTILLTLGAGFLFGFAGGMVVVVLAMTIGCTSAFLTARYLFGEAVSRRLMGHPKLMLLNRALEREGWKIVLLSRFMPVFPFKLSNYFFGLTGISLRGFFFGNLFGILPITLFNVYLGSLAASLTELTERRPAPMEWTLYGLAIVAALGILYYVTQLARGTLQRALRDENRKS